MTRLRDLPLLSRRAGAIGIVALVACIVGGIFDPPAFFAAWLVNWLFLLGIALAAMMDVMIHELTGGRWGRVLRPPLEAAMATMPLVALLAIPLAFGLSDLFEWARPEAVAASELLRVKQWFLNVPGFIVRNVVWLVAWTAFSWAMRRRLASNTADDVRARARISVAGLLVYLFTMTVAAYDWIVSLVPEWSSTAIGLRLGAAQFIAAFGFAVPFAVLDARARRLAPAITPRDCGDFGNLLLTFVLMWAYIAFTQYLIVWGEDIPHETSWYWPRITTSWHWLGLAVMILNFALPVVAMLFRAIKRNPQRLALVCGLALVGQWLDSVWLILPSLRHDGFAMHWLDVAALFAEGGLWLAFVGLRLTQEPLPELTPDGVPAHG
ncbi:MAG TPA: hypothetical protein VN707_07880 [Casimicrobiaceae bacterium]|nr:hypothetical protein [Casimicrobiaceae bacterium]